MKIRFVMESKFYRKVCEAILKITTPIVDYLSGMYTEPKYIAFRAFCASPLVPDISIVMFVFLSKFHFL